MKLLYFARVQEEIGRADEDLTLPPGIGTVGALLDWLAARGPEYAKALEQRSRIRVAVNQDYARAADAVANGDEVAIFPPVTGG